MGAELEDAVPAAKSIRIRGAFDIMGRQKEALEEEEVKRVLESLKGKVDAVAISGYASVRNPKHEQEAAKIAEDVLGIPVICARASSQYGIGLLSQNGNGCTQRTVDFHYR